LNVSSITNLSSLDCSYNQIDTLNLNNLNNLVVLNCSNNQIVLFDLTYLISLKSFDCSSNQLSVIDVNSLTSLESLNCSSNSLISLEINGLIYLTSLDCNNNELSTLSLISLTSLNDLNCNFNHLLLINLNSVINLKNVTCTNNQLISLNVNGLSQLQNLECRNNQLATIDLTGLTQLITLNCNNNQLSSITLNGLTSLKYLYCDSNLLNSLNINGLNLLLVLSCSNNQIVSLDLTNVNNLQSLYCTNNQIATLNLSSALNFQNLFCSNNQLTSIFIKNGSYEGNVQFSNNPNLEYICADETEFDVIQEQINNYNYSNCHVNSYCSFTPGGVSYTVQGDIKFDGNTNGCDPLDIVYPNLQLSFYDGSTSENLFPSVSGNYSKSLRSGSYTITPLLENPNYFSISPTITSFDLTPSTNSLIENFCVNPNGTHSDLEVTILPLNNAQPGLDAKYIIVYKNKGTTTQSGSVNLNFNDAILDVLAAIPSVFSQNNNNLNWSFSNLSPLEIRTILVTLNFNSTSETPSVNMGQLVEYTVSITSLNIDEYPNDNTNNLHQIVVNTSETNDKICLEGSTISSSQVGEYVHYVIRFKNNGTAIAQNIVVKDIIDTSKYDINSIVPIMGSHLFQTRISNINLVEFIFENINLTNSYPNNEGFVAFKIKTLPTLVIGNSFSNTAAIYFDYNGPIATNTELTSVQVLINPEFQSKSYFTIYPNPVKTVLNIVTANSVTINSIGIYNSIGQLIQIGLSQTPSIDVSQLEKGVYLLHLTTENGVECIKFIKE
jgi:Leucine-rich repeat (LRR) protein